jgi:hypothetical protein
MDDDNAMHGPPRPAWWRHGYLWLVIALPASVVVACFVTFGVIVQGSDELVTRDYYRRGIEINEQLQRERARMPAHQARNHAATPTADR